MDAVNACFIQWLHRCVKGRQWIPVGLPMALTKASQSASKNTIDHSCPSHTRVRLSHDFKIGYDFADFKIGTGRSDFENRQICSHTIAIHRSRFYCYKIASMICLVMVVQTLYDDHTMIVRRSYDDRMSKTLTCDFSKIGTDLQTGSQTILVGSDFVFGLKIGSDDRTIRHLKIRHLLV